MCVPEKVLEIYKTAYDNAFPLIIKHNKSRKFTYKQPRMSPDLLKSFKVKNSLYLKFIKLPNKVNKMRFIKYRNKFKTIRLRAEKSYYEAEFSKINGDFKQTFAP